MQKYVCPTFPGGLFICSIRRTGNTLNHSKSKLRTMCSQQWRCRHVLIIPIGTPCLGVGHYKPIPNTCGMKPSMGNVTINNFKWIYDFLNCGILSTDNLRPRDLIHVGAYQVLCHQFVIYNKQKQIQVAILWDWNLAPKQKGICAILCSFSENIDVSLSPISPQVCFSISCSKWIPNYRPNSVVT